MTPSTVERFYLDAIADKEGLLQSEPGLVGAWNGDSSIPLGDLARALLEPDPGIASVILKKSDRIETIRRPLFGEDGVIKKYVLPSIALKFKYLARPSRARRAWAAARTLEFLSIPTPKALGLLEARKGLASTDSFYVCRFVAQGESLWTWIRSSYSKLDAAEQTQLRQQLAQQVMTLYRYGIYHADLKAANMLIQTEGGGRWSFLFIDLDAMQFGVTPSRRQVIRNLVQLNGSLGSKVPDEDRIAFLDEFAEDYPWIRGDAVKEKIRLWTRRRLERELNRTCGP